MSNVSFAFWGTDEFSVTILEELRKAGLVPAVIVTPPDRPKGRGLVLTPPPAKEWAQREGVPVLQPERLDSTFSSQLSSFDASLFVVASYGLIIPQSVLNIPVKGTLNVHPSLLPHYRGATPIESQILADEKEVGVTIMLMDAEMDHGPIVAQRTQQPTTNNQQHIPPTATELTTRLAKEGGELLADVIPKWIAGEIEAVPQDHTQATYTKKLAKTDGEIDLSDDGYKNFLKIQAFTGSIGTHFFVSSSSPLQRGGAGGGGVKKIRVNIKSAEFKDGQLHLLRVIPEGKKEMDYGEFMRGLR
ncbi:MAG: hypothetical protein COV91_02685 [Candidatus Taylorbacteria bacterium CG11_big_fil_rev_8_21_14_0_20_46_11]|uniref:methionyl-tRNA formyltransferase n=1 Tax=Candidatus Taylorbacteria bacterium CG11_big_fil_rev_8_21_14_0_20_46_11 TaxID=1975025 RepID=A0A2H0KBU6_9BACT|nr:MAG: hypothetical protein COV91_02685 [Candidatus Taylorbacteria bacterium CG11_big_fil_rev_8_21_14_0_20_46_11]